MTQKTGLLGRIIRRSGTIGLTLGVAAAAGAAVVAGSGFLAGRAASVEAPQAAELTPVSLATVAYLDSYEKTRSFTGQTEAAEEVTLSFELAGRLTELTATEGEAVEQGQVIARLDTDLLEADARRLSASRAAVSDQLIFAESRVVRAAQLRERGFSSQEALDQAVSTRDELRNRMAEVSAALDTVEINLEKSVLTAPFSGRVGTQHAETSVTLTAGQPVLTLIRTSAPEARVGLPVEVDVPPGTGVSLRVGDRTLRARLMQFRPDLDPVTRTRTALFSVEPDGATIFGQTVVLDLLTTVQQRGAWIPVDALREGSGSQWTVFVLEPDDVVRAASVEIIHAEDTRVFVQGSLAEGARFITSGAHRVVPGQRVRPLGLGG
ncbi:efflux RND transporter periplasmic adaptor subunit [uncultured Roseobacter sp.]|uniref:efflux RND transporter periplasmic adaptor subunit n=1 Tax=uncultured Roseobacter sp. TaxID=114847 RepID=UPI002635F5AE|nr:efflux RND transporter periplasmic adaptor subunit [uncultured Roseobacter sp.]